MKCEQAEMLMAELLAGEIRPGDREALEKHLLDCATCRADFERAREGFRVELPEAAVPRRLVDATLAALREPPAMVRFFRWGTAAAAALCVAALLALSNPAPRPAPTEAVARGVAPARALAFVQDAVVGAMTCTDEDGRPAGELGLQSHAVSVEIVDGIAKTTVEENFQNHTDRRLEGTFHFPLPPDASISRLALEVNGKIEEGTCLEREKAREVFESIVRKMKDPALLEWQPGGIFKCRVFPIEPRATKRVIVAYTQALPYFQGRMTYVYPLASEKTKTHPPGEVRIDVRARFSGILAKVESPSHRVDVQRRNDQEATVAFSAVNYRPENDFVLRLDTADDEIRIVSHKPEGEDGYFSCAFTPQGGGTRKPQRFTFVLDVSASVSGPELEVGKRLVQGMMENRIEGDRFEILAHNVEIESSGEVDLRAANAFLDRLHPLGGCDVAKALASVADGEIIYIGEGTPTIGETEPAKILEAAKGRRIRTIAVGSDANVTLLEKLGGLMRVSPHDDVPKRVAEIAATLGSAVVPDVKLEGGDAIYDVVGARTIFYGERLVLTGRYRVGPAKLVLSGGDYRRDLEVVFLPENEGNNYVRRLWAQRKVADLMAQQGKKDEITALGVKHQIMTPYTSFLVLESEQMWKDYQLKREVQKQDELALKGKKDPKQLEDQRRELELLFGQAQMHFDRDEYPRCMEVCDKILKIHPNLVTVTEMHNVAQRSQHMKRDRNDTKAQLEGWKREFEEKDLNGLVQSGTVASTSKPTDKEEDPKARAIREAYEEQLRRDRNEVTIKSRGDNFGLARSAGWNFTVYDRDSAQLRGYFLAVERNNAEMLPGVDLYSIVTNVTAPGAPITDPLPVQLGWHDGTTGDLVRLRKDLHSLQRSHAGELTTLEADQEVFVRRLEVLERMRDLGGKEEEYRNRLSGIQLQQARSRAEQLQELGELEMRLVEESRDKKVLEERMQLVGKRQPKGISDLDERIGDEDRVIQDKLKSIRVTLDGQNEPLTVVVDRLREISGLNIHLVGIDSPDAELVSVKCQDRALGGVLNQILEPRGKTHLVRDGVVLITTRERALEAACVGTLAVKVQSIDAAGAIVLDGGTNRGLKADQVFAVTRDGRFLALLRVTQVQESRAEAKVLEGVALGRPLPGDRAEIVLDTTGYLAMLPREAKLELASRWNIDSIRAKMGLKE